MSTSLLSPFFLIAVVCLVSVSAQEAKPADQNSQTVTLSVAKMKRADNLVQTARNRAWITS
jgi:hypothetical protein